MTSIQDIQALEERIYDAVQDYIDYPDGYGKDYLEVKTFLETLYISNRLKLPLKGILLIGY